MRRSFSSWLSVVLLTYGQVHAQVNPQNGAAQINIPLYSYSDGGNRIGISASLNYVDGNGLKVSEMASEVGTGWTLGLGGFISRIQHGAPDDQHQTGIYNYDNAYNVYKFSYYPNGYLWSEYSPSNTIDYAATCNMLAPGPAGSDFKPRPAYLADREQDVFVFSFNGRTGQFVIGKNREVKVLNDSKLKIELTEADMSSQAVRTTISEFRITDETGIQYIYSDKEYDYVVLYNDVRQMDASLANKNPLNVVSRSTPWSFGSCVNCGDDVTNVMLGNPKSQYVVNKWHLTRIVNPFTQRSIVFSYTQYEENVNCEKQIEYAPNDDNHGSVNLLWQKYMAKPLRLTSVLCSNSERLDLIYSSSGRIDLPNQKTLDKLQVSFKGVPIYSWVFTYGYMVGSSGGSIKMPGDTYTDADRNWSRLCLLKVQKGGTNNKLEPPYQFTYNMGSDYTNGGDIPPMFSIYQDHYGYYNAGGVPYHVEKFMADFYTAGELKTYLRGNNGNNKNPYFVVAKNGIIKTVTYPTGGVLTYAYEANISAQRQLGGVRVSSITQYDGINHSNDIVKQYKYVKADGVTSSGWGGEDFQYITTSTNHVSACQSNMTGGFNAREVASNYLFNAFMTGNFGVATAISAVTSAGGFFTGDLVTMGISVVIAIFMQLFGSGDHDFTVTDYSNVSTAGGNTLPSGYSRTEELYLNGGSNIGKIVYDFSSPDEHGIEVPTMSVRYSSKPRFAYWVYGLPKSVTVYDKDAYEVKKTVNNYTYIVNTFSDNNFLCRSWVSIKTIYGCGAPPSELQPGAPTDGVSQETYYPLTGRAELVSTDEYTYNAQHQYTVTTTNYEYDYNFQLKRQYHNNSKGEKVETVYYHPYDYASNTTVMNSMNFINNILSPVLSTETYINKSDGRYLIGAVSTEFGYISNGDIKPRKLYSFQSAQPVMESTLAPFDVKSVVRDPSYFKQVGLYDYDGDGNLVQRLSIGNKLASNIYDYGGSLIVASVKNASYGDIGYSSFETDTVKGRGWVNAAAIISDDARTGRRCFNLSDPSNTAGIYFGCNGLNSGLTYIVSFWGKSGTACIKGYTGATNTINTCQGSTGWVQGVTVNGWTYYEKQVSGVDKISMSGTGLVDEFRVYPVGAQMITTTYDPLIGKTSECDVSGRVTYYLYDDLGRLIKMSDDKRNVIRTYEYNYKQ